MSAKREAAAERGPFTGGLPLANEQQFRQAFAQAGVGFRCSSLSGDYLQVNEQFCNMSDSSEAELLRLSVHDTQCPEDRPASWEVRDRMRSGKAAFATLERRVTRKDAVVIVVSIWLSPMRDEADNPLHSMSVVHDISARGGIDAELYESRKQFEQLANHIPQVFWITDAARQQSLFISRACLQVLGYDAQTLKANPRLLIRAIHPDDRRTVFEARQHLGDEVYDQIYRIVMPDQSIRWVHDRAFPVRDAQGKVYRYACIAEHITEWKAAEQRLALLAHFDTLSGLSNRALFHDRLSHSLAQAARHQWHIIVMFVDMDNFKRINDTLGHDSGDALLQQAALRMSKAVRDELVLYYQPKASVPAGEITGYQALLRWCHPERGVVLPSDFVPALEDTGPILAVGAWVVESVCSQLNAWASVGIPGRRVAINLSARQFAPGDLAQRFEAILDFYQVNPRCVELEITESALMSDPETARRTLDYLKALGVRLSIDDFGAGYSSLAYLKRFPIDMLKIDASFVRDIISNTDDFIIARTVITMAHNPGLAVVAEIVETAGQLAFLADHGCDQDRGYYLSQPLPAAAWSRPVNRFRDLQAAA